MSVLKKNELMEKLKQFIGEKTDDETLTFIEDVNDTFDDKSKNENSEEDWKKKYEENDKMWREKYRERFFNKDVDDDDDDDDGKEDVNKDDNTETKIEKFEQLFETKEE